MIIQIIEWAEED